MDACAALVKIYQRGVGEVKADLTMVQKWRERMIHYGKPTTSLYHGHIDDCIEQAMREQPPSIAELNLGITKTAHE